jgi:DNA-binding Xre family transcriptional regulator
MKVSYKKLWKILIDKNMKKKDLKAATHISSSSMAKIGKDEVVSVLILIKICAYLQCDIGDIMEVVGTGSNG